MTKLNITLKRFVAFITLTFLMTISPQSNATEGLFTNGKNHGDWASGQFHAGSTVSSRMISISKRDPDTAFVLDFDDQNHYTAQLFMRKLQGNIGTITIKQPTTIPCSLRIDTKDIFNIQCILSEDNKALFVTFNSGLGSRFISESKTGSTLRVKLLDTYIKFSLKGFTAALNRINNLSTKNEDDSQFFNNNNSSFSNSDDSYFL